MARIVLVLGTALALVGLPRFADRPHLSPAQVKGIVFTSTGLGGSQPDGALPPCCAYSEHPAAAAVPAG